MKKLTILILALTMGVGCHKATVTAPIPLPAGAQNSFDFYAWRSLLDAQAAIDSLKKNIASGQLVLTASQTVFFNKIILDYNTANAMWQTYHSGATGNSAALTALEKVQLSSV